MAVNFNNKEEAQKAIYDAIVALNAPYALQDDAVLAQLNPVKDTWYTVLDTKTNVRIYSIVPLVWTTNETLELRVTTKNRVLTGSVDATHTTYYWAFLKMYGAGLDIAASPTKQLAGYQAPLEDPSIKIEIRKTTEAGTGTLECRVVYAQKEAP
ncbi:MAG: hypothetical protein PHU43_03455 [Candidatus Bipolaricaulis sp.]|nr:hypothetical protein [Candidatus Bipolaricaulis sp.]